MIMLTFGENVIFWKVLTSFYNLESSNVSNVLKRIGEVKNTFLSSVEKTHTIEYGAQWVHGVENNISYQLATSRDLLELDDANILSMPGEFNSKKKIGFDF